MAHGITSVNWWHANVPATLVTLGARSYVGVRFRVNAAGRICGFRYYGQNGSLQDYWALLLGVTVPGVKAVAKFKETGTSSDQWNQVWFHPWYRYVVGDIYDVAVEFENVHYFRDNAALVSGGVAHGQIQFNSSWQSTAINPGVVTQTQTTNANGVDILVQLD